MSNTQRLPIPPHSIEAEQALLGCLLISSKAWPAIANAISASDFYRADHRAIFAAIDALQRKSQAVDPVTVSDELERAGRLAAAGGLSYLGRLARDTPTADNVQTYAKTVRERAALRGLKAIGETIADMAAGGGESVEEVLAQAQAQLQRLSSRSRSGAGLVDSRQLVRELIDDLDRRTQGSTGLQVGLPDFDDLTNGLEGGDLVVIAARPSVGKTALLVSIASTVSETTGVAVFSAEMPAQQLMRRCLALQTSIAQGQLRRPAGLDDAQWEAINRGTAAMAARKLWIDDLASPQIAHIRAECIALKARAPLGLVLVDYCQLVRGPGANRYEQLREVAYGLKALAKDLAVPVIVLAQLNRDVEKREHKRPNVSDLRDSGAIEEAADIVGLLYSEAHNDQSFPMPYVLECAIAKNRNGERGQCLWHFDGAFSRVTQLEPGAKIQYHRTLAKADQRPRGNSL